MAETSGVDRAQFGEIRERIARIPRVPLALLPTPLHEAPNLARALGGPRIFLKRDDLTGVAFGGN
jgi:D-cysteine desulfhydrase/L-cysteate sulfo-lyase